LQSRSFAIWSRAEDDEDVPAPPIRRVPAHSRGTEVNSCASFALADSLVPSTATPPGFSSPAYKPGDRRVITYQGYTRPCAGAELRTTAFVTADSAQRRVLRRRSGHIPTMRSRDQDLSEGGSVAGRRGLS
jgi:hypothetical protein